MATKEKPKTLVVTGKARLSYAHLFEAVSFKGGAAKYSVSVLIPKSDTATLAKIRAAVKEATEIGKTKKWGGKVPPKLVLPLRDGDEEREDDEAYIGHFFVNAKSSTPPEVVDYPGCDPILDKNAIKSGDFARVSMNFYPYDVEGGRGIACGLNSVQKLADGPSLMNRTSAADDFADEFEDDFLD